MAQGSHSLPCSQPLFCPIQRGPSHKGNKGVFQLESGAQRRKRAMDNETSLARVRGGGWSHLGQTGVSWNLLKSQEHLLSPQISDILTPAAPRSPHSRFSLFLSCSSGYVWNQQDEQSQGHGIQAGHDLRKEGCGAQDQNLAQLGDRK